MSAALAPEARGLLPTLLSATLACFLLAGVGASAVDATATHPHLLPTQGAKPAFALAELDGRQHALADAAGRVVLVHFFATWCEPCRDELASLRALVASQHVPLSVIAVDVGEVPARVRRFLEGTALNFPVLLDGDRAVTKAWSVYALPTTYVLDRSLMPRLVVERDLDWTKADVLAALGAVAAEISDQGSTINREERK